MRNGLFLCFALLAILGACRRPAPEPPPHVVLVTIDTLRADHLGFAGYARDTSPHLDALAKEGVAFTRCYSASATTGAAHASLFTSRLPGSHSVLATLTLGAYGSEQLEKRIGTLWTVLREPWRYVRNSLDGSEELYDHRGDPTEATNVAAAQPAVVAALRAELDRYFAHGRASAVPVEMTPEHAEALKALGYTQ